MKPLSWDKQLGLASPLESAAGQSNQTNNPSMDKDEAGDKVELDASHHTRIFLRGGENLFFLTSSFIGSSGALRRNQSGLIISPGDDLEAMESAAKADKLTLGARL
jgi:hypothetical protein